MHAEYRSQKPEKEVKKIRSLEDKKSQPLNFSTSQFLFFVFCILPIVLLLTACGSKKDLVRDEFDPAIFMQRADNLIDRREYENARSLLLEVKNRDLTRKYAPLAQFKIADSYIKEGYPDAGIEEYRRFLALYPHHRYASHAQYQIAMAYFNQIVSPDRGAGIARKALEEFIRLKELYPRNPFREVVELRIEKCRNIIADGEFMVGQFYYRKGSYNAAINRFEGLLLNYPDYLRADETLLLLGRSYKALNMEDKARNAFRKLIEKYPSSRFVPEAKKEIR
jgi:outer membrane protein assembly factor BamD